MNHLQVIEGLCKVCTDLAEIVRLLILDPAFGPEDAESLLARSSSLYKELTGDELIEGREHHES